MALDILSCRYRMIYVHIYIYIYICVCVHCYYYYDYYFNYDVTVLVIHMILMILINYSYYTHIYIILYIHISPSPPLLYHTSQVFRTARCGSPALAARHSRFAQEGRQLCHLAVKQGRALEESAQLGVGNPGFGRLVAQRKMMKHAFFFPKKTWGQRVNSEKWWFSDI